MKRKITALCVALCIVITCFVPFQISAASALTDEVAVIENGSFGEMPLTLVASDGSVEAKTDGLGGKSQDDTYSKLITGTTQSYFNFNSKDYTAKNYVVLSVEIYGQSTSVDFVARMGNNSKLQVVIGGIAAKNFIADAWNRIIFVYNTKTNESYYMLNGKKSSVTDVAEIIETATAELDEAGTSYTLDSFAQLRIIVSKNVTNGIYYDNVKAIATDAEPTEASIIATIDGTDTGSSGAGLILANGAEIEKLNNSIGGKPADEYYTSGVTAQSGQTYINLSNLQNNGHLDTRFIVLTANFFGNSTGITPKIRYNTGDPNVDGYISKDNMLANRWNNICLVYDHQLKQAYYIFNGVVSATLDCGEYLQSQIDAGKSITLDAEPALRLVISEKGTAFCYDDVYAYKTDVLPGVYNKKLPSEYGNAYNSIVISSAEYTDYTPFGAAMSSADGGVTWKAATNVGADELMAVPSKQTDLFGTVTGTIYKYVKVMSKSYSNVLATQSTMSYAQGGSPYDSRGNLVTDARIQTENVLGSGKTMELVATGTNNAKSLQSYYSCNWNKANDIRPVYLVAKFNFAYPEITDTITPAGGISISTNGGKGIGASFGNVSGLKGRVNEYVWIYNTYTGTYNIFINDKIYFENQKADETFVNGDATAIRLTVSTASATTDGGTSENLVGMYMSDIEIIECNTAPITGGKVTDSISWKYDEATETLYLEGSGVLPDYTQDTLSQRPWQAYTDRMEKLVIKEGITRIGSYAMADTAGLESVVFPSTIKAIGNYSFADTSIQSINLNSGLTQMGTGAFMASNATTATTKIIIPATVTAIGADAIKNRSGIVIECCADSYAHSWALENNLEHILSDRAYYITYSVKNAAATVYNFTGSSIVADVVFANYKDGALQDISIAPKTTINGGKTTVGALDFEQPNGTVTKVIMLNSIDKPIPVCKASSTKVMPTIRIAGDSISAEWSPTRYGQQGWGKAIQDLWNDDIAVINDAVSGWTTEMYYTQKWPDIKQQLREGDYLLVSYLHNDYYVPIKDTSKADYINTYKDYLQKLIDETKAMGVNIVLVVPPNRGVAENFHGDFSFVMPELAEKNNVPLIDVHAKTLEMLIADTEGTKKLIYMYKLVEQGIITQQQLETHSNLTFRNSGEDLTHISTQGAEWVASYVADNLVALIPELSQYRK